MLNLDASLRVHARYQFFNWTQSSLRSLIGHEVLICARRNGGPELLDVDSFLTLPMEPSHFSEVFRRDASFMQYLVKKWKLNRFQPVIFEMLDSSALIESSFVRELTTIGATNVIAHGTHDAAGQLVSFFTFACYPGTAGPRQAYLLELIVSLLHSAWMRSQINWAAEDTGVNPAVTGLLTLREQEILSWAYIGKSNIEIGMILKISPLTVKNHMQKIFRKLNVLNRTQAVGKALALRILKI